MDQYKFFLQRIGLVGVSNFLITMTPIIFLPIITQNLSISDYAVWIQFQVTITLVTSIAILGLPYTLVRFMAVSKSLEEIKESFYSFFFAVLIAGSIAAVILYFLSGIISNLIFNGNLIVGLILPLTALMSTLMMLFFDYFRAFNQMRTYAVMTTLQAYMVIFFAALLLFEGFGLVGAVAGVLITQTLITLIMFIIVLRQIGFKIPGFLNLREYLTFGLPTIPSNASFWVLDASDRYVIGLAIGINAVGFYSAGYTISSLMSLLTVPLYTVLLPILSQYYAERKIRETRFLLNYSIKLYILVAVPMVVGLSILAKPLLYILSTPALANVGYTITPILAIGGLIFGLYCIVTQIIVMERKTRITGYIWVISTVLNIILDVSFGYLFGIVGIAVTTLLIYLFAFLVTSYYAFSYIRCNFYFGFLGKVVIAALSMAVFLLLIYPFEPLNIVLTALASLGLYILILLILKGIRIGEIKFFIGIIKESMLNVYISLRGLV
ncbi:MAG: oligosaccharide flippase family protein [Methanobacterium sp.]